MRGMVAAYMLMFALATTWPGVTLLNHAKPFVLGLPFNLFALALIISIALVMLGALYISETRGPD